VTGPLPTRLALLASAVISLCALPSRAGVEVLGFSTDGRHVVILEHGVADGSGFPWAKATILDVARNAPAAKPIEVTLQDAAATEAAAVEQVKKGLAAAGEPLKLAPLKAPREIGHDEKGNLHDREGAPIGTVKIEARKAGAKEASKACEDPFSPLLLKVQLFWMDDDTPAKLLVDKKVPKDRACLTGCELGQVFADGRTGLFILQCGAPGFEGPATRSVPVVAKLAYGLDEDLPGSDAKPSP
jgi:predicted secreted protein